MKNSIFTTQIVKDRWFFLNVSHKSSAIRIIYLDSVYRTSINPNTVTDIDLNAKSPINETLRNIQPQTSDIRIVPYHPWLPPFGLDRVGLPFSVLPSNLIDILFLDGERREINFPYSDAGQGWKLKSRGQTTCWYFSNLVNVTAAANSIITWDLGRSSPLRDATFRTLDALGRRSLMRVRTWAWLIGYTDMPDEKLLEWALSYSEPPSMSELKGAQLADEPFVPERQAIGLKAEKSIIEFTLIPGKVCVNPVIEIPDWSESPVEVGINGYQLTPSDDAWDGDLLWISKTFY